MYVCVCVCTRVFSESLCSPSETNMMLYMCSPSEANMIWSINYTSIFKSCRDFSSGPVVENLPSNTGDVGLIPLQLEKACVLLGRPSAAKN